MRLWKTIFITNFFLYFLCLAASYSTIELISSHKYSSKQYKKKTVPANQFKPLATNIGHSEISCGLLCAREKSNNCASFSVIKIDNLPHCKLGPFIQNQSQVTSGDAIFIPNPGKTKLEISYNKDKKSHYYDNSIYLKIKKGLFFGWFGLTLPLMYSCSFQ